MSQPLLSPHYQQRMNVGQSQYDSNVWFSEMAKHQIGTPATEIELQRANQHIYELQREKDTLKILLGKYQNKQISSPTQSAIIKSSHQRQASQGTPTTATTAWTRSQVVEFSSPTNGYNAKSQLFNRNASGSKDRVKEGIDQVKEGMQHLIKAINNRSKEITQSKKKNDISYRSQDDQRKHFKDQKVSSQHNKDYLRRNICNQDSNLYDFSSDSDIVQTIVSDSSYGDIQSKQQLEQSVQQNQLNYKQTKTSQHQWDIPNHNTNSVHSNNINTQQLVAEAEQLMNSIKLNKKAYSSFSKMFGSEQAFYAYLSQPDSQNSTALIKVMGLLQDFLENQMKVYNTSSTENNQYTIPILTQNSLPSQQWSSITPQSAIVQYPQRPISPVSIPSPFGSADNVENNLNGNGNVVNQGYQSNNKMSKLNKDQSFRQEQSCLNENNLQGGNNYQDTPFQIKELSQKGSIQRAQIVSSSQNCQVQSLPQNIQNQVNKQNYRQNQPEPQMNSASIQDQFQIQPKWQQQINRRNQVDLNRSSRQQRSQIIESSQHLANSQIIYSNTANSKLNPNNQLTYSNQSSLGIQNPPIRVQQLVQGFDGSFQNSGKQTMQQNNEQIIEGTPRNNQGSFLIHDIQSYPRLGNQQSLNYCLSPNSSVSADKNNNNSNRWSFSNLLYAAPQDGLNNQLQSQNITNPQENNLRQDNNNFTDRTSDKEKRQPQGRILNVDEIHNTKSRQAASVDSSVAQAALQTLNQFFNTNNQGEKRNEVAGQGQEQYDQQLQQQPTNQYDHILTYNALQQRNKGEDRFNKEIKNERFTQSCSNFKQNNNNINENLGQLGCSVRQKSNLRVEQLPERNNQNAQAKMSSSLQGFNNNLGQNQSWMNSVGNGNILNKNDIANLSLSGRNIPNSRANSARPIERQEWMITDRINEGTRQTCGGQSSERTREVAGELRELKQREALLKMYEYGGEITGLEGRLEALKKRVQEENRIKEEQARNKILREQLEMERLRLEIEAAEKRRKEELEMKKREKEMAEEMRLRRQEEEYYKRMNEIRIAEERIQREKEEELRRKQQLEEEDRKRKAEIIEQERLLREEKQAYLLQRKAEQEEFDRIKQLEEAQILAKKREMEAELERVRQKEEQEKQRKIKQEEEERQRKIRQEEEEIQKRQRQLDEDAQRRQAQFEKEERERMEREEQQRQLRLLEEEEMERKRQEEVERQRQEIARQLELERKNRKLQEELNSNYMKATEARVNYVRSVHKEYLRRSNTTLIEAAQCSPSRKQTQIIANAGMNPKWEKVLSKFTNGELKDLNEDENQGSNGELVSQDSHRQIDGVQGKLTNIGHRSENSSPLLVKRNIKESLTTPRSMNNKIIQNQGVCCLDGNQGKDQLQKCSDQMNEEHNDNYNNQTFQSVVQDINRRSLDGDVLLTEQVDNKEGNERITENQLGSKITSEDDKGAKYLNSVNDKYSYKVENGQKERETQITSIQQEQIAIEQLNNKTNGSNILQQNQIVSPYQIAQLQFPRITLQDASSPSSKNKESARYNTNNVSVNLTKPPIVPQITQIQSLQKHLLRSKSSADTQITQSSMKSPSNNKTQVQGSSDSFKLVLKQSNDGPISSGNSTPTLAKSAFSSGSTKERDGSARKVKLNDNSNSNRGDILKKPVLVRKQNKSKTLVAFGATLPLKSALKTSFASVIATVMDKGMHHAAFKDKVVDQSEQKAG